MNKTELIAAVAENAGIGKTQAAKAVSAFEQAVTDELKAGRTVSLPGFGTFSTGQRAERQGRNPKTGEALTIAAAKTVKFSAGKTLKETVNG